MKRGSAHAWSGRWEQAAQEYKLALKQSPRDSSAKTYLAMALFKSGQLREALDLYQELWDKLPSNLSFLQRLAEVQEAIGDLEPALTSYRLLATTYERLQQPSEAVKGWRKAVALSPLDSDLWDALLKSA
ncbi:MAG TPA: tetratricopeptide repeat protein, partial [Chloroflexota bacterium]|nr:tetratricopeptide repeat protein [Chloroflexota bacterium]